VQAQTHNGSEAKNLQELQRHHHKTKQQQRRGIIVIQSNIILEGDSLEQLKNIPDAHVNCIVTPVLFGAEKNYRNRC
jgi:hypothetical protein